MHLEKQITLYSGTQFFKELRSALSENLTFEKFVNEKKNPYFFKGENPTVDILIFRKDGKDKEVLLIKRGKNSAAEAGKWAIPGGFHDTDAKKGQEWLPGKESAEEAAYRELAEETGLVVRHGAKFVGKYSGSGRDPRDNKESWSASSLFVFQVSSSDGENVKGMDDAEHAKWIKVNDAIKLKLAFDHNTLLKDGIKKV